MARSRLTADAERDGDIGLNEEERCTTSCPDTLSCKGLLRHVHFLADVGELRCDPE